MRTIRNWFHAFIWRSWRIVDAAWTMRDIHYFVIQGDLYAMHTNGSPQPYDWTWELVQHL
jgi:hypothetical protein